MKIERKWWALVSVGSGVLLSTIDGSIVNIALNSLVSAFDSNLNVVEWVSLAYLLTLVSILLTMGRLGDIFGRRRIFIAGFVIFTTASVLCGLAPTIGTLIGFRVLQAVGAAMLQGVGPALLVAAFPPQQRGMALGAIGSFVALGILTGPVLGGLLLSTLGWQSIFFVNVPIGLVGSIVSRRVLPADQRRTAAHRFDVAGAALLAVALLGVSLGLTEGPLLGWSDPRVLLAWGIGLLSVAGFLSWEWFAPHPMVNLRMFRHRVFSGGLLTAGILFVGSSFNLLLTPLFLQLVYQFDLQRTGFMLMSLPAALSILSPLSGRLSDQFGSERLTLIGLIAAMAGLFSLSLITGETHPAWMVGSLFLLGSGMGLFQGPNNSAVLGSAPHEALGVAGSLTAVMRTLGQTIGIALAGALLTGEVYRLHGGPIVPITAASPLEFAAGYHYAMRWAALVVALAVIVTIVLRRTRRSTTTQE